MKRILFLLLPLLLCQTLRADFVNTGGQWRHVSEAATGSSYNHYGQGIAAYECEDWSTAIRQLVITTENFSCGSYPADAYFFLGVAYFQTCEYECANEALGIYLKTDQNPIYLTEAVEFKFASAEAFRQGARARVLGYRRCPKWASGYDLALTIYDEVIATLPSSDLAARALFSKGSLLCEMRDFRCSIEAFQTLIRRFPKHELTPDSYLAIDQVYLHQAHLEFQNPDILVLAELNRARFSDAFPNEERVEEASAVVAEIEEIYAWGLYSTGCFYERTCKPAAALLYYYSAISQFPDTQIANRCRSRQSEIWIRHPQLYGEGEECCEPKTNAPEEPADFDEEEP